MLRRFAVLLLCASAAVSSVAAAAPLARSFVSSTGNDANPCSLVLPCRGFQAAINAVAPGGEVVALDSGGYGAMQINKSVSVIVPPGVHAGLSPSTGIALPGFPGQSTVVLIDIADTDTVVLRGLVVNHQGSVTGGIDWISANGGTVYVENTIVHGFPNEGLFMMADNGVLRVKDSVFRSNGYGIYARGGFSAVYADHVRIERSMWGLTLEGASQASLRDVAVSDNVFGLYLANQGESTYLYADRCGIHDNATGVRLQSSAGTGQAKFTAMATSIFKNATDIDGTGPSYLVHSMGNNSTTATFQLTFPPK